MLNARRLGVALLLGLASVASAQTPVARETAASVAKAIEDNYFDAGRAADIARELRQRSERGEFDALVDPRDLAAALTAKLEPHDAHFAVHWSSAIEAQAPPTPQQAGPRPPAGPPSLGLREVELLPGNIAYIDLRSFAGFDVEDAKAPARRAIDAALTLAEWSDAIIIDVRLNGGGSPAMVGYLSSAFTPKGADIFNTFHSRQGTLSEAPRVTHPAPRLDVPLYILTSPRTGSAAEAFAYTMKHAGRATVVGEASTGAANPGGELPLGNGFRVFVSNATPINPITKRNWEGDGVQPDIAVPASDALRRAQIEALQKTLAGQSAESAPTATLWALEALQAHGTLAPRPLEAYAGTFGEESVISVVGDHLELRTGLRPARVLRPLPGGDFTFEGDPSTRARFEADAQGRVGSLELRRADGNASRHPRSN